MRREMENASRQSRYTMILSKHNQEVTELQFSQLLMQRTYHTCRYKVRFSTSAVIREWVSINEVNREINTEFWNTWYVRVN